MRNEFVFAVTLMNPSSVKPSTGVALRIANRIEHAQGYLGAVSLSAPSLQTFLHNTHHCVPCFPPSRLTGIKLTR
jgi:L-fucose isomerase-like protein